MGKLSCTRLSSGSGAGDLLLLSGVARWHSLGFPYSLNPLQIKFLGWQEGQPHTPLPDDPSAPTSVRALRTLSSRRLLQGFAENPE